MRSLICLLILTSSLALAHFAAVAKDSDNVDENSTAYERFRVYPHLQSGLAAQEKGNQGEALKQFRRARELAPKSPVVALHLARAYEHYGQYGAALHVVRQQLEITPNDEGLLAFMRNVELRQPLNPNCLLMECRIARAEYALNAKQFDEVLAELEYEPLALSDTGILLRRNVLQEAIAQQRWYLASSAFAWMDAHKQLQDAEKQQWVWMLLQENNIDTAIAVQRRLQLQEPTLSLAIGLELAKQPNTLMLSKYLTQQQPHFREPLNEREWLQLMMRADLLKPDSRAQFPANQVFLANLLLPQLQREQRWDDLASLLAQNPELAHPELNFELALRERRWPEASRYARQWIAQSSHPMQDLDRASYGLTQAGQLLAAQSLLIERWPFTAAPASLKERLVGRLTELLPKTSKAQALPTVLTRPLPSAEEREMQAQLLTAVGDCPDVVKILGNLAAPHSARNWAYLGDCYGQSYPGLAEYAYAQAARLAPSDQAQYALAYQAHANQNYDTALDAWRQIDMTRASPAEQLSAIRSAVAAGDKDQAGIWLAQYRGAGLPLNADYWRLLASTQQSQEAVDSLKQAVALAPQASDYSQLAAYYAAEKQGDMAEAALLSATQLEPNNREYQSAYGYTLLNNNKPEAAVDALEKIYRPTDFLLTEDLAFINQRLGRNDQALTYATRAADMEFEPQERLKLGSMIENMQRRWTINLNAWTGTSGGSQGSTVGGVPIRGSANSMNEGRYQNYTDLEIDYRLGAQPINNGRTLSAVARIYAGSQTDQAYSFRQPTLGLGLRWKPLSDQNILLAAQHLSPLSSSMDQSSDVMLRASASFLNGGTYSDDWREDGAGWWARNLYLDGVRYLHAEQTSLQAAYRHGYHYKIGSGKTLEPYARLQGQRLIDSKGSAGYTTTVAALGVRWNNWFGERNYGVWPHKMSVGFEYQRVLSFNADIPQAHDKDVFRLALGVRW